ncbi:sigma-70 family RNA polymerase sigma factor [Haloferula sp.]|uniref:sigma-70 family RNA polymerase sigma factor n=1 Tax=Haloferula sp. TaxID=2497595 RepID=UPI00329F833F
MTSFSKDTHEFVRLLTDHQELLRSYILSQMPNVPDVRDVLQEVNVVLCEKMGDFKLGTNFGAWACTVAYYTILDHRKKMKRSGFLIFNEELCLSLAADSGEKVPAALESKRRALKLCMGKMSPANRKLIEARYESHRGGMDKVVEETGRSRGSLRVTLSRLRASLRNCIRSTIAMEGGTP